MRFIWAVAFVLCCVSPSAGQTAAPAPAGSPASSAAADEGNGSWSFSAAAYTYLLPDEGNYAQPTLTADREWLHLEGRYNYEELETASAWVGYNFSGGETVEWELTPMLGGVFGAVDGVAPGYKGSVSWRKLGLSSEGEYVFDAHESDQSFFYNWSELTFSPGDWWRVGLVTQRTRVYATERDLQRGLLVGVSYRSIDSAVYVLNPDDSKPVVVLAVTVGF